MLKRTFDLFVSTIVLLLLAPVFLIIAILIKKGSEGPVFFRQTRVGLNGQDFTMVKFRTMTVDEGSEKGTFEAGQTNRITRIGCFLRSTKIDELPQFWNVFKGDMSLVGPRPEVRYWVEQFPQRWAIVHKVKPGITDPASVEFRNEEAILRAASNPDQMYRETILPKKLDLYESYAKSRSFTFDIKILLSTFFALFMLNGKTRNYDQA